MRKIPHDLSEDEEGSQEEEDPEEDPEEDLKKTRLRKGWSSPKKEF